MQVIELGSDNINAVFLNWAAPLSRNDKAFRLLVYMAHRSCDKDTPEVKEISKGVNKKTGRWYPQRLAFGNRDSYAIALGCIPPSADEMDTFIEQGPRDEATGEPKRRESDHPVYRQVKSTVRVLVDKGAIHVRRNGSYGSNAIYEVALWPGDKPSSVIPKGASGTPPWYRSDETDDTG